jgi:NTP pyrophosphatase (non-canonical NTP hydrolase)
VAQGMAMKYPFDGCSYCKQQECACEEKRPDADLSFGTNPEKQREWSLHDFQDHLKNVYGTKNSQKGIEYINNRLTHEYGEIVSLVKNIPKMNMNEIEKELQLELADCLAWVIAMANFYNIDLQDEIIKRYGDGCHKCEHDVCACGPHDFFPTELKIRKTM